MATNFDSEIQRLSGKTNQSLTLAPPPHSTQKDLTLKRRYGKLFGYGASLLSDNIISYIDMCRREGTSLQQGMNFGIGGDHSVILMSVRRNAPYKDRLEDGGTTLVYEGHDQPRGPNHPNPKTLDQPERFPSGSLTQNGKFHEAAQLYKAGKRPPERVRVYEKIQTGIWSYNGIFHLVDSWKERDRYREVFKYRLIAVEGENIKEWPCQTCLTLLTCLSRPLGQYFIARQESRFEPG